MDCATKGFKASYTDVGCPLPTYEPCTVPYPITRAESRNASLLNIASCINAQPRILWGRVWIRVLLRGMFLGEANYSTGL